MLMGILTGGGPAFAAVAFVLLSFFAMTEKWKVKLKGEWIQTAWLKLQSIVWEVQVEENWKIFYFIRDN